jgi:hypothetical protein
LFGGILFNASKLRAAAPAFLANVDAERGLQDALREHPSSFSEIASSGFDALQFD